MSLSISSYSPFAFKAQKIKMGFSDLGLKIRFWGCHGSQMKEEILARMRKSPFTA